MHVVQQLNLIADHGPLNQLCWVKGLVKVNNDLAILGEIVPEGILLFSMLGVFP